jgi:hypothetical protein
MPDPELYQALDYILNKSNEVTIEALAEAVARRRRDLTVFNAMGGMPDPQKMAKDISEKINTGIGSGIEGMRRSIREMMLRVIKEHAPELTDVQVAELCQTWLPDPEAKTENKETIPQDMLLSMIEQFVSFSRGSMKKSVDKDLRDELGAWPERYWKAFPPVVRQIITDYLKDKISEKNYKSQICIALGL